MAEEPTRKLAVLLHADVVGSTALVQQNETLAHQRIQDTFRRFSETIAHHSGIAHEIRGDALVAEFARASDAVSASLAFQSANTAHNKELPDEVRPVVRVGIAMGEVVVADNIVTGEGVVLAQRLEQLAQPGGVCIQDAAYQIVPKRLPFEYENLGEHELKGFDERLRVYAVTQKLQSALSASGAMTHLDTAPELPDKPSIAVLPFTNMSGDPDQEYFSDGITEDIITELSHFSGLFVIARNSSFAYKGERIDIKRIARELGVRYVLEGSVRRAESRIRINAQLLDSTSASHLWAERFDKWGLLAIQMHQKAPIRHALMIASYGHTGDLKAAARHTEELMAFAPDFICSLLSSDMTVYKRREHNSLLVDGLRKAGLPESPIN